MLATDRTAVICDLAETYGILDMRRVPVRTLCTLAAGLGQNSRIRLKQNGLKAPWEIVLLAMLVDALSRSTDKTMITSRFLESEKKTERPDFMVFDSPDDFRKRRAAILGE